jgi:DNA-binding NarL/FixJ family response regulator
MSAELSIRIAIADDHKIFRDGIKMALKGKEYLKILWEAEDGKDLMHKMQLKRPDVLLMDIRMPEVDGVNAIGILRKEYDEVKIIVLTMYDDQEMITRCWKWAQCLSYQDHGPRRNLPGHPLLHERRFLFQRSCQ